VAHDERAASKRHSIWTDLEVGYAETNSTLAEGFSSIKGKTVAGFEFYKSKYFVNGARSRREFEMRFRPGPFSLKSEYIRVTEERLDQSVYNTDLSPLTATGWYVSGTWALTGEMKTNGLDEPNRPILRGGIGAVEIGARVEKIAFSSVAGEQAPNDPGSRSYRADVVLRNSDQVLTYGVNWYPNRWFKIQFNLIREVLADPTQGPSPLSRSFWSTVIRFQTGF
jgi:phosphate-selective porin